MQLSVGVIITFAPAVTASSSRLPFFTGNLVKYDSMERLDIKDCCGLGEKTCSRCLLCLVVLARTDLTVRHKPACITRTMP